MANQSHRRLLVLSCRRICAGLIAAGIVLVGACAQAQDVTRLCDWEDAAALKDWEFRSGTPRLVAEGATHGARALEITFDPRGQYYGAYMYWNRVPRDWSAFDALVLDVLNPNPDPVAAYVLIADQAWIDKGRTYWNRHNAQTTFPPGRSEWLIPVRGLYRGEAGSRNNDLKRNIDPDSIVRMDLGFGAKGTTGRIILDNLRFVKANRPKSVWAFDFGPPSQSVMLGWTAVSQETRYTPQRGFGWGPTGGAPWNGAARDTTFGTALIQDFCEAGGYNFRLDAPAGRYRVMVIYENSGYWGGEQAQQGERRILVNGKPAWSETRPDGPAHALYRFEDVEPVGVDIWDTYMKDELARPVTFEARSTDQALVLRFEADRVWGSKVAALAVHRADDAAAAKWLKQQLDALATEFRRKAVCLDRPAPAFDAPAEWRKLGLVAWPVRIEDDVTPNTVPQTPPQAPNELALSRLAVRSEYEPLCVALRPLRDLGNCRLDLEPLSGPGRLSSAVQVVHYNTSRGFGNIAYHIKPHTLREQTTVPLPANVTREIIVTVKVPAEAPAGQYRGALVVKKGSGEPVLRIPLQLSVEAVTLSRDTDFLMGFFGLMPPGLIPRERRWEVLEQTLVLLREHGMNAVSGGPNLRLKGWQNGKPVIDFGEMDRFFALLRKHGFVKALNGYGGARFVGLHDRYQKGRSADKVAQQSGLPYAEALMRAWRAVDAHARQAGWPTILYAMCDETRVREVAERELEFMQMMAKVSAAFPQTIRTSGSYSVAFTARPTDKSNLLYWHQRFFEALDISSLNRHDESVMAEAQRRGKEIHIYNQGRTRYSFGLYQWSEYQKGVRARWQWHLNILHGYQFFDLDGREPDTAMLCYGRHGLYPTIHFERCREGAEDFYLYQTLSNLIAQQREQGAAGPQVDAAAALLGGMTAKVKLNQRQPPEGFDADALKGRVIAAIRALTANKP